MFFFKIKPFYRASADKEFPSQPIKTPKLKSRAFDALRNNGGELGLDQLAKEAVSSKWALYKAVPSWPEVTLDKGRSIVRLKLTLKEWVDLFYVSNEGTYMVQGPNGLEGQAFAYATDPEIVIRRIAGRLGLDPQNKT